LEVFEEFSRGMMTYNHFFALVLMARRLSPGTASVV